MRSSPKVGLVESELNFRLMRFRPIWYRYWFVLRPIQHQFGTKNFDQFCTYNNHPKNLQKMRNHLDRILDRYSASFGHFSD